jgi:hypothetical protein
MLQPNPSCRPPMLVSAVQVAAAARPTAATTTLSVPARHSEHHGKRSAKTGRRRRLYQAIAFGDDAQMATNYLVRLKRIGSQNVNFYQTFNHSSGYGKESRSHPLPRTAHGSRLIPVHSSMIRIIIRESWTCAKKIELRPTTERLRFLARFVPGVTAGTIPISEAVTRRQSIKGATTR